MLLSSLYEPEEVKIEGRCLADPIHKKNFVNNVFTDYAADMTIALAYFKCKDDWEDEHKITRKGYTALLSSNYKRVKEEWPKKCKVIENSQKFWSSNLKL